MAHTSGEHANADSPSTGPAHGPAKRSAKKPGAEAAPTAGRRAKGAPAASSASAAPNAAAKSKESDIKLDKGEPADGIFPNFFELDPAHFDHHPHAERRGTEIHAAA